METDWLGTLEEQEEFEQLTQSYVEQPGPLEEVNGEEQMLEFTDNQQ